MKRNQKTLRRAGFTLTELLVAMAIIAVLSAITVGVVVQSGDRVKYQQTETFIAMLENSLESYYFDNGNYPRVAGSTGGLIGDAHDLFQQLGGYNANGTLANPVPPSYADYLEPTGKNVSHAGTVWGSASPVANFAIIDPFKNYIRYKTPAAAAGGAAAVVTNNPDFDLWSVGADRTDDYLTAGAGTDDVRNW